MSPSATTVATSRHDLKLNQSADNHDLRQKTLDIATDLQHFCLTLQQQANRYGYV